MRRRIFFWLGLMLVCAPPAWASPAVAFHYGTHPPADELQAFDWVVVQPYSDLDPLQYDRSHSQLLVYVSAGELNQNSPHLRTIPRACVVGSNQIWQAHIIDQSNPACRRYFLDRIVAPLWQRGFRGFFLDTLDSYQLVSQTDADRKRHEQGLVALIEDIKARYPQAKLILNRGFPFLPKIAKIVDAVAAESLYQSWNQGQQVYSEVSEQDRQWLRTQLDRAKALGLEVIVIDYLPPEHRVQARQVAKKIQEHGFIPWITNAELNLVGVGLREVLPRKVLMLHNGNRDPYLSNLNNYLIMPLNYLGYSARPHHISDELPGFPLTGAYAGIITWFEKPLGTDSNRVWQWLKRQKQQGVPVVILGSFGFPMEPEFLTPFGLNTGPAPTTGSRIEIASFDPNFMGFEIAPKPTLADFFPLQAQQSRVLLRLQDCCNHFQEAAAITPWGGYVLDPFMVQNLTVPEEENLSAWILNPFTFLKQALRLPPMPVPDLTTRSGRRLLMVHIDGDGFAALSTVSDHYGKFAGEVLSKEILNRYRWPTEVSLIVGEFIDQGIYPDKAPALRRVARKILALPWVEAASHTYSHPFNWQALETDPSLSEGLRGTQQPLEPKHGYGYNLAIPGYRFDPKIETAESARLLDQLLAPPGKPSRIINWSGDTRPGIASLQAAYQAGLLNINGGGSVILHRKPSLTFLYGNGIWKGGYFQVFAPIANENDFTNLWRGPFYGFKRVIHTFELTDSPRRLKPIDIYYHFYSADRPGALNALKEVYAWAARQETHPVFTSTYIESALGFERLVIARENRQFVVRNYGQALTLRLPVNLGDIDLASSRSVAGFLPAQTGQRYVHLVPGEEARLALAGSGSQLPYLSSANATATYYARKGQTLTLKLQGEVDVNARLATVDRCALIHLTPTPVRTQRKPGINEYQFNAKTAEFSFRCR